MVSYREDIEELKQNVKVIEGKLDILSSALQLLLHEVKNDATKPTKRRTTNRT